MKLKKLVKWLGRLLMVAAAIFIIRRIGSYRAELLPILNGKTVLVTALCSMAYGGIIYMLPFIYQNLLRITAGSQLPYAQVGLVFCRSNIYKYLPGNVMQYVGRNQLAVDENLSHVDVAAATVLEIFVTLISSGIIIVLFSWNYAAEWLAENGVSFRLLIFAMLGCCAMLLILLLVLRRKLLVLLHKYSLLLTRKNLMLYLGLILYNVFTSLLTSALFLIVLRSVGVVLMPKSLLAAIGLFSLSFLLGYITPGVPGGIGIREAVLTYFFGSIVDSSLILAGALLFRIVSILGDIVGYIIAALVSASARKSAG